MMAKKSRRNLQRDAMDCGPKCLDVICSFYGLTPDYEALRQMCDTSKSGVSMFNLNTAAKQLGFDSRVLRLDIDALREDIVTPCIAFVDGNHFVVVEKSEKDRLQVFDPAKGDLTYSFSEFKSRFYCGDTPYGYILELKPTERLKAIPKTKRKRAAYLFSHLKPYKREGLFILITLAIGCIAQVVFPVLMQKIVDVGISRKDISILVLILMGELMLVFSTTLSELVQRWIVTFVGSRINVGLIYSLLNKLVMLPIHFFSSRRSGDILARVSDQYKIENFLTVSFIQILVNGLTLLVFSVMTLYYNVIAFMIMIVGDAAYLFWIVRFLPKRRVLDMEAFKNTSDSHECVIEIVNGITELKLNNYYPKKSKKWIEIQKRIYDNIIANTKLNQKNDLGASLISELTNVSILFFAAYEVITGEMSLGVMLALQYITGQMATPIHTSVDLVHSAQDAIISLDRNQEIINQKEEKDPEKTYNDLDSIGKGICFSDVSFTYNGTAVPALNHLNLLIPSHKITAIVGESGSGKSTLIKMLLAIYRPTSGKISVNDFDLSTIDYDSWRNRCGAVLQEGYIYSDTIIENIIQNCPFDKDRFSQVTFAANIESFANNLPLGYNTRIGTNGHGLSMGQQQRILIARALYKMPEILIFDEATNSLDAKNEKEIWNRLKDIFKGKTVIISAHRLNTIRFADQIIVMKKGEIAETGTHNNLLNLNGEYSRLINSQLQ